MHYTCMYMCARLVIYHYVLLFGNTMTSFFRKLEMATLVTYRFDRIGG